MKKQSIAHHYFIHSLKYLTAFIYLMDQGESITLLYCLMIWLQYNLQYKI